MPVKKVPGESECLRAATDQRAGVEAPNSQMLLDPLEEQFHLPTLLVELANS